MKSEGESASAWQRRHQERAFSVSMMRKSLLLVSCRNEFRVRSTGSRQRMTRRRAPLARQDRLHPGSGEVRSQCRGGTPFPRTRDHQVVRRREAHRGVSAQLLWRNRSRCLASGASRYRPRLGSGSSFSWQCPNSARIAATCERGFWFTTRKAV